MHKYISYNKPPRKRSWWQWMSGSFSWSLGGWILAGLIFLGCVGWLIYYFLFSFAFTLKTVDVQIFSETVDLMVPRVSQEDIRTEVEHYLQQTQFWIIPQSNFFFFQKKPLIEILSANFPLTQIDIYRSNFHTLRITGKERQTGFIWFDGTNHYFMDYTGGLIDMAGYDSYPPFLSIEQYMLEQWQIKKKQEIPVEPVTEDTMVPLPVFSLDLLSAEEKRNYIQTYKRKAAQYYIELRKQRQESQSNLVVTPGTKSAEFKLPFLFNSRFQPEDTQEPVVSASVMEALVTIQKIVPGIVVSPELYMMVSKESTEIQVFIEPHYWIVLDAQNDIEKQLQFFATLLDQVIDYPDRLEYIDLRFPPHVYYKYAS